MQLAISVKTTDRYCVKLVSGSGKKWTETFVCLGCIKRAYMNAIFIHRLH